MGTEYKIYEDAHFGELTIDERSNKFTLDFTSDDGYIKESKEMTPEELAKVLLRGLTVCSYWMSNKELQQLIIETMYNDFGGVE